MPEVERPAGSEPASLAGDLRAEFERLHVLSVTLVMAVPPDRLYWGPGAADGRVSPSFGECLLRSAAAVEQTFGGITASLWDDPFEWTLPETLRTPSLVAGYLREVEATRQKGFALIRSDDDLRRRIAVPSGGTPTLFALLAGTLFRAVEYHGAARVLFNLIPGARAGDR